MDRSVVMVGWMMVASLGCAPTWKSKLQADTREVARALADPVELAQPFDPKTVPDIEVPDKIRPCCAFGQDMHAKLGPVPIPIFENKNVLGPEEVGPHGYDGGPEREHNGLVYTCRGGFIDIAHIRDNADRTLYLALQIVRALPGGVDLKLPEEGTDRRVTIAPLPDGLLERHGRWTTATALASWASYQFSIWHEVVTWYGWESTPGFSEKLSAFSPEDLYSNVLGINLAAGIVLNREVRSRESYDESMQAWITEALRRLGVVDKQHARHAMAAVDGLWWDSKKKLPEMTLVTRRSLDLGVPVSGWIVADAVSGDATIEKMCAKQPPPLPLRVPEKLGDVEISKLVTIQFTFAKWIPEKFPLPAAKGDTVTVSEFPQIVADIRREGQELLGPDFDRPGSAKEPAKADAKEPAKE